MTRWRGGLPPRVIGLAARTGEPNPSFDMMDFYALYPQFFTPPEAAGDDPVPIVPIAKMKMIIDLAHASITYAIFNEAWRECMGLFIAHNLTMYLKTADDPLAGQEIGLISSKSVDGVSVSYDNSAITDDLVGFGYLKETTYGVNLAFWVRMMSIGGLYVR